MRKLTVRMPDGMAEIVDSLDHYMDRSEAIRDAVREKFVESDTRDPTADATENPLRTVQNYAVSFGASSSPKCSLGKPALQAVGGGEIPDRVCVVENTDGVVMLMTEDELAESR